MGFDFENFGIGLVAGWVTAYGVYRARHLLRATVQSVTQQASSAQSYANQSADRRYINDLVQLVQTNHLAGRSLNLSDILVEPRFVPAPPLVEPLDEEVSQSVFKVVPVVPDHLHLLAPYNVETFSIEELSKGGRALAVLGRPGSGRTTALLSIVLYALGQLEVRKPVDKVQQRLDAEEAALDEKQRAVRIKDRVVLAQRAKEQYAKEHGGGFDVAAEGQEGLSLFNQMMPVYVHLADINPRDNEFGAEIDPAEPLVRTVQRQLGRIAASTIPKNLYKRLNQGRTLLLLDGYDDLPESDRPRQLAWLEALMSTYPENFYIVTGPARGYGALTGRLHLTPLFLRPWSDRDMEQAVDNWAESWQKMSRNRRTQLDKPAAEIIQRAKTNNRAFSPLDLTLKIWANFAGDAQLTGQEGWIQAFITRLLPGDQSLDALLPQLAQAAALQIDEEYITEARLAALVTGQAAPVEAVQEVPAEDKKTKSEDKKKDNKEQSAQARFLSMLHHNGLTTRLHNGGFRFRYAFLTDYLASLSLKEVPVEELVSKAAQPAWGSALGYVALHRPIDEVLRARLSAPADILHSSILEIANWLPYTSADAEWRVPFLKYVATLYLSPSQYPLIRERAAAALVATRDKSVLQIFRQALRNANPHLRRLACLGIGALGEEEGVDDLIPLLSDEDGEVQIAAALGLSAVQNDAALTALVEAFTEGSERLRQAIAETFSDMPEEGYPILYDAIQDQEMLLRRAAVFGLKRVKSTWSLIAIYRAFLEDQQWYVRSAAQLAFQELQQGGNYAPQPYPPVEAISWLSEWAGKRGENIPPGEGANLVLLKALQEGDAAVKMLAAADLGQLGVASTTRSLYAALRDRQEEVREAAHRALADLELQIGKSLPAPV
jgi:HEAT repeat protein